MDWSFVNSFEFGRVASGLELGRRGMHRPNYPCPSITTDLSHHEFLKTIASLIFKRLRLSFDRFVDTIGLSDLRSFVNGGEVTLSDQNGYASVPQVLYRLDVSVQKYVHTCIIICLIHHVFKCETLTKNWIQQNMKHNNLKRFCGTMCVV